MCARTRCTSAGMILRNRGRTGSLAQPAVFADRQRSLGDGSGRPHANATDIRRGPAARLDLDAPTFGPLLYGYGPQSASAGPKHSH